MRLPIRALWRSAETHRRAPSVAGDFPTPGQVLTEIGLLLAVHLAVAFAVVVTLRLCGIA